MAHLKLVLIFSIVFCSLKIIEASVRVIDLKEVPSKKERTVCVSKCFENGKYIYYTNETSTPSEMNMTVHLLENPITRETKSCNVTLKTHQNDTVIIFDRVTVSHLGKDRGLILWNEENSECEKFPDKCDYLELKKYVNFVTIHFPTCTVVETKINFNDSIPYTDPQGFIVPFDDFYDVYYNLDFFNGSISFYWVYRMSIDYNGTIIGKPSHEVNNSTDKYRNLEYSSKNIYIYKNHGDDEVILIKPHGSERLLLSKNYSLDYGLSVSNETIGICTVLHNMTVNITSQCMMYDLNGNLKWTSNIDYKQLIPKILLSLDDGGLLVLSQATEKCDKLEYDCVKGYFVKKIDSTGRDVGEFHLQGQVEEDDRDLILSIWKNESGEGYCAGYASKFYIDSPTIFGNCFSDSDFSFHAMV